MQNAMTMTHWKKRQFQRLKRSWRRQSRSLPRSSECAKCGEMRVYIQKISEYEAGPDQEPCIHKTAGTDAVYYKYCIYQEVCRGCGYKSPAWDVRSGETAESATVGKLFPGAADGLKNL